VVWGREEKCHTSMHEFRWIQREVPSLKPSPVSFRSVFTNNAVCRHVHLPSLWTSMQRDMETTAWITDHRCGGDHGGAGGDRTMRTHSPLTYSSPIAAPEWDEGAS
jgi:hypothetical protein